MSIFYQLLMELPLYLEREEEIVLHFKDSLYTKLQPDQSRLLSNLIKTYLKRIQANTCTREASLSCMRENNPRFILRNYLLHQAIEELEKGEHELFLKLQQAMKEPYSKNADAFFAKRPDWASQKAGCSMLSCSS
jgi:uncharacterized protein YdiU (UPF0061 family)